MQKRKSKVGYTMFHAYKADLFAVSLKIKILIKFVHIYL